MPGCVHGDGLHHPRRGMRQETEWDAPRRLRQPGRVVGVEGGTARIAVDAVAGCGTCAARSGCATRAVNELGGRQRTELCLPVPGTVTPGQPVLVTMPASDFLAAATLALLLPATAFVGAIWLCSVLLLSAVHAVPLCAGTVLLSLCPLWRAERSGRIRGRLRVEPDPMPEPNDT